MSIYNPEVMDKITLTDTLPSPNPLNAPKITNPVVPTYKPSDFQTSISESSVVGSDTVAKTTMSIEGKNEVNKSGVGENKLGSSLDKIENFAEYMSFSKDTPTEMDMTGANLEDTNLRKNWTNMVNDKKYDFSSNVVDTNGYGYVASLDEVRNKDAVDLYQQEHATFAIGAIAGVSLIVLGILLAASSNGNSS